MGIWGFVPLFKVLTAAGGLARANVSNTATFNINLGDNLLSFFLPPFFNGLFGSNLATYYETFMLVGTENTSYIGYTVLLLAAYAVYKGRKKPDIWLWFAIAVVFALLALGPVVKVGDIKTGVPTLYALYHLVPVINIVREPGRFDLVVTIALSVLAAVGASKVLERFGSEKRKMAITAAFAILFLIECNSFTFIASTANQVTVPVRPISGFYYDLGTMTAIFPGAGDTIHPGLVHLSGACDISHLHNT